MKTKRTLLNWMALILAAAILAAGCHHTSKNPKDREAAARESERRRSEIKAGELIPPPDLDGQDQSAPPPPQPSPILERSSIRDGACASGDFEGGVAGGTLGGIVNRPPLSHKRSRIGLDKEDVAAADELIVMEECIQPARQEADDKWAPQTGSAAETPVTQGVLQAMRGEERLADFPLKHTEVTASISGYIARTEVRQDYHNPFDETIEAVYVFPLGAMAAVNGFVMEVGDRKIVGIVRPRAEAEQIYADARARGQTASLLTQERPNIFTQNVANIAPGGEVSVRITTFERLPYERGTYEYVFPMVVGPRYIPGAPSGPKAEGGWSAPTTAVPDAHRITPPVLKPGERSGHDIGLTVHLDAGFPVAKLESPSHEVEVFGKSRNKKKIVLSEADAIANKDFVLRWSVAGEDLQFGVLSHRDETSGYFTLMMQPPLNPEDEEVMPREITFLLDVSGSMSGVPIETSKRLVTRALDRMRPQDTFNLYFFASGNGQLWPEPRPNNPANVAEAKRFLSSLSGGGGTEMLAGVRRALQGEHDLGVLQMFVFCTDGYIGDEERILRTIKEERGEARFYAFGIGSSVNRYLIESIGEHGNGKSVVVLPRDAGSAERAADRLFDGIDSPMLVDVAVDWNGLPVADVYPKKLGDLFAGETISLVGRYEKPAMGTVYVTGRLGARNVRFPVEVHFAPTAPQHRELAPLWARHRIHELSGELLSVKEEHDREAIVQSITDLAVAYRLTSAYTAFVAVDESEATGNGDPVQIHQPVEMPEDVSYEGIFGSASR